MEKSWKPWPLTAHKGAVNWSFRIGVILSLLLHLSAKSEYAESLWTIHAIMMAIEFPIHSITIWQFTAALQFFLQLVNSAEKGPVWSAIIAKKQNDDVVGTLKIQAQHTSNYFSHSIRKRTSSVSFFFFSFPIEMTPLIFNVSLMTHHAGMSFLMYRGFSSASHLLVHSWPWFWATLYIFLVSTTNID